jgi:methylenetetrahydrofolate reductase (NADPH)
MRINEVLKNKRTRSFEFFPPKDSEQEDVLFNTVERLAPLKPDFVSVTYGAGGSTRARTFDWTKTIKDAHRLNTMMHLTCVGNTVQQIGDTCEKMLAAGIFDVFALRGDTPQSNPSAPKAFEYASGLVSYVKKHYPEFAVGVAGYPEKHPEAPDMKSDILSLKKKVDAGADFIITQLFFDNSFFYRFVETAVKNGITVPIIAGIMPVVSYSQIVRFTEVCGATLPPELLEKLEAAPENAREIGLKHALRQAEDLTENGVAGIHYYTLNRYKSTYEIIMAQENS